MQKGSYPGLRKGVVTGLQKGSVTGLQRGLFSGPRKSTAQMDVFLIIGNSISAGTGTSFATQPIKGRAFEFDRTSQIVLPFGQGVAVNNYSNNKASFWAPFSTWYYNYFQRIPVIVNRGAASSTCSPANDNNDWQVTGSNYRTAVAAAKMCLQQLGKKKLKAILIGDMTINDVQNLNGTGSFTTAQIKAFFQTLITNLTNEFGAEVPILLNPPGRTSGITISTRLSEVRKAERDLCVSNPNCYIGSCKSGFQVGSYYSDLIHPNESGYTDGGLMYVRWFKNPTVSKWPRSIICCHFGDLAEADKGRVVNWYNTWKDTYFQMEYFYPSIKGGISTLGGSLAAAFDWTFLCAPSIWGGYSQVSGSYIATSGTQYIDVGWNPSLSARFAVPGDIIIGAKLLLNNTAAGTAAFVFGLSSGANILGILQTTTPGITYAASQAGGSDEYLGETKLNAPAWWTVFIESGVSSLVKNGSVLKTFASAGAAFPSLNMVYMCRTNDTPGTRANFMNGRLQCMYAAPKSAISNVATFEADIDTLQT